MTWEQKLQALKALAGEFNVFLKMRQPGDWYVRTRGIEVGNGHSLTSPTESGRTPEEAVEAHWGHLTALKPDERLVVNADGKDRRAVKWNGFMWADYDESGTTE